METAVDLAAPAKDLHPMCDVHWPSVVDFKYESVPNCPSKAYVLSGTCLVVDTPGINRRIYPRQLIQDRVDRVQKHIQQSRLLSELNHPRITEQGIGKDYPIFEFNLMKSIGIIRYLQFVGDELKIKIELADPALNEPSRQLISLLKMGYVPGFSIRGAGGDPGFKSGGFETVTDEYCFIGCDVVANPSYGDMALATVTLEAANQDKKVAILTECANQMDRFYREQTPVMLGHRLFNAKGLGEAIRRVK